MTKQKHLSEIEKLILERQARDRTFLQARHQIEEGRRVYEAVLKYAKHLPQENLTPDTGIKEQ